MMRRDIVPSLALAASLITLSQSAEAYIGPGAGISAIGTVLALFGAILLGIIGFVWYPMKRLFAKSKRTQEGDEMHPRS